MHLQLPSVAVSESTHHRYQCRPDPSPHVLFSFAVVVAVTTTPIDLIATRAFLSHTGTGQGLKNHPSAHTGGTGMLSGIIRGLRSAGEPLLRAFAHRGDAMRAVPASIVAVTVNQLLSMMLWQSGRLFLLKQEQV